jgi:hypothetical protein
MIRGEIISYILNVMLLEDLSPYEKTDQYSSFMALTYMKQNPFFINECGYLIEAYYKILYKKFNKHKC